MSTEELEETIRYMAENAHQAYHDDQECGWWECPRNICTAAQRAIPEIALRLGGDALLGKMQTPEAREGMRAAFDAGPRGKEPDHE